MTDTLDNILSGQEAVTEQSPPVEQAQEPQAQEQTAAPETPDAGEQPAGQKMVPHEALHAEKQKVKRYTEQIASFEQTLKQRDEVLDRRFNQLLERLAPQQQPQQVDWFQDPDAALKQGLDRAVSPLEQKFSTLETQIMRLSAIQQYGPEKVTAFESYIQEAMSRGDPELAALSAQMRSSPDPVGVGLKWFEKRTFDPEAERERIKAELLKEMQSQPAQRPAAVMPTNLAGARNVGTRSGPAWSGPPKLDDIFAR